MRVRQVVILAVGAVWHSAYELYAHSAAGRMAGLSQEAVETLAAGEMPGELSASEQAAWRFTHQLTAERQVEPSVYDKAQAAVGTNGLADMLLLIGAYQTVCGLLNAFEIRHRRSAMSTDHSAGTAVSTVATFPEHYFLENLAVRSDNSVLVTALNHMELWWVPPFTGAEPMEPVLVHAFEQLVTGIVEAAPDVFYVSTSDGYTTHESYLHRVDLRGWSPGMPSGPETVVAFDERVGALNGSCLIAERTIVLADSFAGLIWRVDLPESGGAARARVWLRHPSLDHDPESTLTPPQPGVNGVRFAPRMGFLYYTSTAQRLFMRVRVDPVTHDPAGEPEYVAGGTMADDFCLDEGAGVAYVTTHRQNSIDRVPLQPRRSDSREIVVGDPLDELVLGPSSAAWGRGRGEHGRVAYVTTDGGMTSPPPDGRIGSARLLQIAFPSP